MGDALAASDAEAIVHVLLGTTLALTGAEAAQWWFDRGPSVEVRATEGAAVTGGEDIVHDAFRVGSVCRDGVVAVPVRARNRALGVLTLHGASPRHVEDVERLAEQAGAAIDMSFRHDETRRLSLTDGLTGLWNRRQFDLRVTQELERAARFGERFGIVLVDLDNFKGVNDTHGHLVGDAVLVETARRLVAHTREVDTVARYGGEEFVLLLPQTDHTGALNVAEKVRTELADAPVDTDVGPLPMTLSAGVASHPDHGATMDELLRAADAALYAAKGAGKNRVLGADPA